MELIKHEAPPKPCDYFDMIGGTSTGVLIAIMLGKLRMSVDECIAAYEELSDAIVTKVHHRIKWRGEVQGRFDHKALEDRIKKLLVQYGYSENTLLKDLSQSSCKTFVCATSKQAPGTTVLSSYYSKRRGNDLLNITKIWRAARATSAASTFFDPIKIGDEEFLDGATGANSPINTMWMEANDVFNDSAEWNLKANVKCFVSIGIGKTVLSFATDSKREAENFRRPNADIGEQKRFFRFNVAHGLENIGLEDASKRKEINRATRTYIQNRD